MSLGYFVAGVVGGVVLMNLVKPGQNGDCCSKLADLVDGKAGGTGLVKAGLDALGLTSHLPDILSGVGQ